METAGQEFKVIFKNSMGYTETLSQKGGWDRAGEMAQSINRRISRNPQKKPVTPLNPVLRRHKLNFGAKTLGRS